MSADIIDGKEFASRVRARVARQVAFLAENNNLRPGLAVVLVGDDPASQVYVRNKGKSTIESGMKSEEIRLPDSASQQQVLDIVDRLNKDPEIHGILVQLPLPDQVDEMAVLDAIDPAKDVDGFHVINTGRQAVGLPAWCPVPPLAVS